MGGFHVVHIFYFLCRLTLLANRTSVSVITLKNLQLYIENFKTDICKLKTSAQNSQSLAVMGATIIVKDPTSYKSPTKPCCIYLAVTDISSGFHNTNKKTMKLLSFCNIIWAAKKTFLKIFIKTVTMTTKNSMGLASEDR